MDEVVGEVMVSVSAQRVDVGPDRAAFSAALLHDLWGDDLPPGGMPWERVAADILEMDDDLGAQVGRVVSGDHLTLAMFREILAHVPAGASLLDLIPQGLLDATR